MTDYNMSEDNLARRVGRLGLYVISGDITQVPSDAILTAINSEGLWFGGVDSAIQRVAGNQYHGQAAQAMPLSDGYVVIAKGNAANHRGKFNDVVFVVDDLVQSLDKIVYAGLERAHNEGYRRLAIPAIRMGVMAGVVEKTPEQTVEMLGKGILKFMESFGFNTNLRDLVFVVYRDENTLRFLNSGLKQWPNPNN